MFRSWGVFKPLRCENEPHGNFEIKRLFQTKESEFITADCSAVSGVLS